MRGRRRRRPARAVLVVGDVAGDRDDLGRDASSARAASSAPAPRASMTRRHERRASPRASARPKPRDAPVISAVSMGLTLGATRPGNHWEMILTNDVVVAAAWFE